MKNRNLIYRHAWWVLPVSVLLGSLAVLASSVDSKPTLIASAIGLGLGFCYFAQSQSVAEIRLFKELFTEFNARYDKLNEKLLDIQEGRLSFDHPSSRKTLVDYFNLCAEEYLFQRLGHIHDEVWRSWCRGMLFILSHDRIRELWDEEAKQDSYYGLSVEEIQKGAGGSSSVTPARRRLAA